MRKQVIALFLGLITVVSFAQKNELKMAEKAIKKLNFTAAANALKSVEPLIEKSDLKYQTKYYFLKGKVFENKKDYKVAGESFNKLLALSSFLAISIPSSL